MGSVLDNAFSASAELYLVQGPGGRGLLTGGWAVFC
jgi:hypothetical protein